MENQTAISKSKKSPIRFIVLGAILITGLFFGIRAWRFAQAHESTDNAQIETQLVPVIARVSGYIKNMYVKDYDSVKAGALLVELDDMEMQLQLQQLEADYRQAEVDVDNAKANLASTLAAINVNKGNVRLASIKKDKAQGDFDRDHSLYNAEAITTKQLEDSKFNLNTTQQQLKNAQTDLSSAQTKIAVLETTVKKAIAVLDVKKAMIDQQKLKISYTKITAPLSGRLGKKNISTMQFVQTGMPLFTVVNDSTFWIVANFKENQIARMHEGSPVDITLDAYPHMSLKGKVESLSEATGAKFSLLPPDNASGNFVKVTQRVPIKISIDETEKYKNILRAGLSVKVVVSVAD